MILGYLSADVIGFFGDEVDLVEIDSDEVVGTFVVEVVFDVWEVAEDRSINSIWIWIMEWMSLLERQTETY